MSSKYGQIHFQAIWNLNGLYGQISFLLQELCYHCFSFQVFGLLLGAALCVAASLAAPHGGYAGYGGYGGHGGYGGGGIGNNYAGYGGYGGYSGYGGHGPHGGVGNFYGWMLNTANNV